MEENSPRLLVRFRVGDWIALTALGLALCSFGWQVWDEWTGAQIQFLSMSERTAELRCHSMKKDTCWGKSEKPNGATGRLTVVLPVFFANTGAVNKNAVVDRVTAEISYDERTDPIKLVANQFWQLVQSGGSKQSRPFIPFVVEGKKANGAELRFAPHEEKHFVNWRNLVIEITEGRVSELNITASAYLVGDEEPLTQSCHLRITQRLQEILKERMSKRSKQARLSTPCL